MSASDRTAFDCTIWQEPGDLTRLLVYADLLDEINKDGATIRCAVRDIPRVLNGEDIDSYPIPPHVLRSICRAHCKPRKSIDLLTPGEKALFPWFRKSWLAQGLATGPCDRQLVRWAVDEAYRAANIEPPKAAVWLDGPHHGMIGAYLLSQKHPKKTTKEATESTRNNSAKYISERASFLVMHETQNQVSSHIDLYSAEQITNQIQTIMVKQVEEQTNTRILKKNHTVSRNVWDRVADKIGDQVSRQTDNSTKSLIRTHVNDRVSLQTWHEFHRYIWDQVGDEASNGISEYQWHAAYGSQDAGWLSYHSIFSSIGLNSADKLMGLMAMSHCGWWWSFKDVVILTELPTELVMRNKELRYVRYLDGLTWGKPVRQQKRKT